MQTKSKPPVCIDFDGVIHSYISGWAASHIVIDEPMQGAEDALNILIEDFTVLIYSYRCKDTLGREAIAAYMEKYALPYDYICMDKPIAVAYIDDNGYKFENWKDTVDYLEDKFGNDTKNS